MVGAMRLAVTCATVLVFATAGCGSSDPRGRTEPESVASSNAPATTIDDPGGALPDVRGLTFAATQRRLRALDTTWRWILIQETDADVDELEVCTQEPAAGNRSVTQVTLAVAEDCDVELPELTGMALGDATKLLDANKLGWALEDGVDIDFPASLDSAPPYWHVCDGDAGYAVDDAVAFLSGGDSYSGMLYGDGESVVVFLQVAPDAASCYTTNDGEEP